MKLLPHGPYTCKPNQFGFIREKYVFSNYSACKQCSKKELCCKNNTHRSITRYNHELLDQSEALMEIKEFIEKYKKRSCVEAPNGSYMIFYHINEMHIIGIKFIQCIMDGIGASYNLKRLFNIIKEKEINIDDVYNFMDLLIEHRSEILSTGNL